MCLVRRGAGEPPLSAEERVARDRQVIALADQEVISKGITSFQDAGSGFDTVDQIKQAIDEG